MCSQLFVGAKWHPVSSSSCTLLTALADHSDKWLGHWEPGGLRPQPKAQCGGSWKSIKISKGLHVSLCGTLEVLQFPVIHLCRAAFQDCVYSCWSRDSALSKVTSVFVQPAQKPISVLCCLCQWLNPARCRSRRPEGRQKGQTCVFHSDQIIFITSAD